MDAFWSVTMYDGKTQLLIENPINRYLINSPMLPGLKKNADGSLTLYIQKDSPGADKESNWLPAPNGDLPRDAALLAEDRSAVRPTCRQWHLAATGDRGGEVAVTTAAIAGKAMAATARASPCAPNIAGRHRPATDPLPHAPAMPVAVNSRRFLAALAQQSRWNFHLDPFRKAKAYDGTFNPWQSRVDRCGLRLLAASRWRTNHSIEDSTPFSNIQLPACRL